MARWGYGVVNDEDLLSRLRDKTGVVVLHDVRRGFVRALGTVFAIAVKAKRALCATAGHVLEHAGQLLDTGRPAPHPSSPFVDSKARAMEVLQQHVEGKRLIVYLGDGATSYRVLGGQCAWGYDLAVLDLEYEYGPVPRSVYAIDSDQLDVDERVILIGREKIKARASPHPQGMRIEISSTLQARVGSVLATHMRGRGLQCPVYETNIPVPKGWSGSPLLRFPKGQQVIAVVAVASSDLSRRGAYHSHRADGSSTFVPGFFLHALRVGRRPALTLHRLYRQGIIQDVGRFAHRIRVQESADSEDVRIWSRRRTVA